jgi:hypothetical protein
MHSVKSEILVVEVALLIIKKCSVEIKLSLNALLDLFARAQQRACFGRDVFEKIA